MARIRQKTLQFPGLNNTYTFADEADLFDSSTACKKGKYYIYNGDLYKCTTDHTGAWDATHFTAAKLGNELAEQSEAISGIHATDNYVEYNSFKDFSFASNSERPNFSRYGNIFRLDGSVNVSDYGYIKLSEAGSTNWTKSANTAKGWTKSVSFASGHTYQLDFKQISGVANITDKNFYVIMYTSSGEPTSYWVELGQSIDITPGNISCNVILVCQGGTSFTNAVFVFSIRDITEESLETEAKTLVGGVNELRSEINSNTSFDVNTTMGKAYSWWTNNTATDSYGNLYFGYISDKSKVGVACRFVDGTIHAHDLFTSGDNDDHNAPSVIIVPVNGEERVCVIGSTGHNVDSKINVFIADEPNTVNCTFTDKSHTITAPSGYKYENSYSQAYYDSTNAVIINFFRLKQTNNSLGTYHMIWMCAKSSDGGDTWSIYRVFTVTEDTTLFYMYSQDGPESSPHIKRIVLQVNTTNQTVKPLRAGFINTKSLNMFDDTFTNINKPMTLVEDGGLAYDTSVTIANYDDFTSVVSTDEYHRFRILDVLTGGASGTYTYFLYAKSVENVQDHSSITDWKLYRYKAGTVTEIANLGLPFFVGSSYVTGACFVGDVNHLVYSKNDSETQDGKHSLHYVVLDDNNQIVSDDIIKWSDETIARPKRYDGGNIMYLKGKYREGQGTKYLTWHFGIGFIESI